MAIEEFVFEGYRYDPTRSTLSLCYSFNEGPRFEEQLLFDFVPQQLSGAAREVLDQLAREPGQLGRTFANLAPVQREPVAHLTP